MAPADPATVEEAPADATPRFRERTKMRRRMRDLRRLREVSFRDLGGLSFDLHRFGRERPDLVAEKLASLQRIDAELRALETALDARRPLVELREPGIAACPRCGTLHGTDANFCPGCGTPLRGSVVSEAGPLRVTPVEPPPPDAPS
ncbi:MAG TPA: zinc ribbon domain-containing protein [Solirubrobacteraceae bacterium]|nr:zinc ribbon domain-containing protein [Solirubrobacteraceae bacterium]